MKALFYCILLMPLLGIAQINVSGKIVDADSVSPLPGVKVELVKDGSVQQDVQSDIDGDYKFENVAEGIYRLRLSCSIMRETVSKEFKVNSNTIVPDIIYSGSCPESKKVCPHGHTNNIIRIVYGFPGNKMIRKASKGKIKLGGCDPSLCERWHCTIHDIDF